jgi:hypothetical protein
LDIYLTPSGASRAFADAIPVALSEDRAAAFGVVAVPTGGGCRLESDVARVTAQAALLGLDAAVNDGILAAQSSWLADGISRCAAVALDAVDRIQLRPDQSIASVPSSRFAGTMLFSWFLDDAYGTGGYGAILSALIAATSQLTPDGAHLYENEPDVFDGLRQATLEREMSLGDLLIEYAVARAFVGSRSDESHLRDVAWMDTFGRIRFEWAFSFRDLPKRVAPAYALEPTGAGYVWLDLRDAPAETELTIVANWEETHVFQWAAVRLDPQGRELGRHGFGGTFGESSAQLSIRDLSGVGSILIVGTHLGNDDRSKPYDPDDGAPQKASYTVTVHPE